MIRLEARAGTWSGFAVGTRAPARRSGRQRTARPARERRAARSRCDAPAAVAQPSPEPGGRRVAGAPRPDRCDDRRAGRRSDDEPARGAGRHSPVRLSLQLAARFGARGLDGRARSAISTRPASTSTFVADQLDRCEGHLTPLSTTGASPCRKSARCRASPGWADSRPVRTGNEASGQRQLDALASVLDAVWVYANSGGQLTDRHRGRRRRAR